MDDTIKKNEIFYPETISENPFPVDDESVGFTESQQSSGDVTSNKKIPNQNLPRKRVAFELIGSALNTKSRKILAEFEFAQSGSIQIGKYDNGVSGDIRITPNGITARDSAGLTTFALDGTTGDAVFRGTIQAGAIISGMVTVGNNSVIIDGENHQIIVNDGTHDRVLIGYQEDGF